MFLGYDYVFYLGLIGAFLIRLRNRTVKKKWHVLAVLGISVFVGWAFATPVVVITGLNPEVFTLPVGILLALTAEDLAKQVMNAAEHPFETVSNLWKAWKGK